MDAIILICISVLIIFAGLLAFSFFARRSPQHPETLAPFSILPVPDSSASTRAFLELFAGQIAWMDSSVLQSVVLMYSDEDLETGAMCREIAQQYDFFSCMSLTQAQSLLAKRMILAQDSEKKSESSCNLSENTV